MPLLAIRGHIIRRSKLKRCFSNWLLAIADLLRELFDGSCCALLESISPFASLEIWTGLAGTCTGLASHNSFAIGRGEICGFAHQVLSSPVCAEIDGAIDRAAL